MLTLHQAQSQIKSYQRLIWSTLAIGLIFLAISTNRWMTMIGLVLVGLTAFNLLVGLCTWPAQDFKAYKQIVRERKAAGRIGEQLTVLEEQLVRLNLAITRPHDRNVNHDSGPCDYCREITELRELQAPLDTEIKRLYPLVHGTDHASFAEIQRLLLQTELIPTPA